MYREHVYKTLRGRCLNLFLIHEQIQANAYPMGLGVAVFVPYTLWALLKQYGFNIHPASVYVYRRYEHDTNLFPWDNYNIITNKHIFISCIKHMSTICRTLQVNKW